MILLSLKDTLVYPGLIQPMAWDILPEKQGALTVDPPQSGDSYFSSIFLYSYCTTFPSIITLPLLVTAPCLTLAPLSGILMPLPSTAQEGAEKSLFVPTRSLVLSLFWEVYDWLRFWIWQGSQASFWACFHCCCRAPCHTVASQHPQVGDTSVFEVLPSKVVCSWLNWLNQKQRPSPYPASHTFVCFPSLPNLGLICKSIIILWIKKMCGLTLWFKIKQNVACGPFGIRS